MYAYYLGCCLLGAIPALAILFLLGATRRASIPHLAWWLSLILAVVISFFGLSHSTVPSFSNRNTAVGKAYDYVQHVGRSRHGNVYQSFRFVPEGGEAINIETEIILPRWGTDERMLRVVYLTDSKRFLKNEAVDITILSGRYMGFHDSRDARPFGTWLALPIGGALLAFGIVGLRYRKNDGESAASERQSQSVDLSRSS